MADYTPVNVPGKIWTSTASAAITGGDILVVSGSGTVAKAAAIAATNFVGVAADDTAINGRVTVYGRGIVHESLADGTVTAGDQVGSTSTAGRQVKTIVPSAADLGATYVQATVNTAVNGAITAARGVVGIAITTASDNAKVRWIEI
jgi:hypothetical protein